MKLNNFIAEKKYYQKQLVESDIVKDGKSTVNDEGQWIANGRQWNQVLLSRDDKKGMKFNKMEFQNYYRKNITYPLHFIDFETSRVAIPFESGHRPYELYVFQYFSILILFIYFCSDLFVNLFLSSLILLFFFCKKFWFHMHIVQK